MLETDQRLRMPTLTDWLSPTPHMENTITELEISKCGFLVIDDDDFQSALVTHVLERIGGSRIFSANNADDGYALAQQHKPDFVLLDIYMPQIDGWAILEKLRRIHPGLLAIMVTGSQSPADFNKSMDRYVDGFCIKPVLPDVMLKALRTARRRSGASQDPAYALA